MQKKTIPEALLGSLSALKEKFTDTPEETLKGVSAFSVAIDILKDVEQFEDLSPKDLKVLVFWLITVGEKPIIDFVVQNKALSLPITLSEAQEKAVFQAIYWRAMEALVGTLSEYYSDSLKAVEQSLRS